MAARKNLVWSETVRERIKTMQLVNRLTSHCLGQLKKPLDSSQVTGILGLLKKTIPDLQAIEHSGTIVEEVHTVSAEPLTEEQWAATYGGAGTRPN
jgi:hypothetical protein